MRLKPSAVKPSTVNRAFFTSKPDLAVVILSERALRRDSGDIQNLATLELDGHAQERP